MSTIYLAGRTVPGYQENLTQLKPIVRNPAMQNIMFRHHKLAPSVFFYTLNLLTAFFRRLLQDILNIEISSNFIIFTKLLKFSEL